MESFNFLLMLKELCPDIDSARVKPGAMSCFLMLGIA